MCVACGRKVSVTAGTIFDKTRTPLTTWFAAVWYVTNQKNGVSALGLQRVLGLGSYQTAWAMLHKLRRAMVRPDRDRLSGIVEVDETYVGGDEPGVRTYHLLSDGRKMAKSAGNFYQLAHLVGRGADPLAFRYLALQTRYREPTNFTWDALGAAHRGLEKYRRQMAEWFSGPAEIRSRAARALDERFRNAVADDLNTPRALTVVAELAAAGIEPGEKYRLLSSWDAFLGLDLDREVTSRELPAGAPEKIAARERAREVRDWASADRIRAELAAMGVEVIDTPKGTRWLVGR